MHALSVGQGDCIVLQLPDGRTMVIDGAGSQRQASDPGRRVILPALRYLGIERVDVLVLSHRDWDHLGGLFAIVEALPVGELWFNGRDTRSPGLLRFLRLVRRKGIPIKVPLPGARRFGGLRLEVLQPREDAVRRDRTPIR